MYNIVVGIFSRRNKDGYDKKGFDKDGRDEDGYDEDGYNRLGWNRDDINRITGTRFDKDGFDKNGFGKDGWTRDGNNRITGTRFDNDGFDKNGFDKDGFDTSGINKDTLTKFDKYGWTRDGNNIITGTRFDKDGFDKYGFDKDGLDKSGLLAKSFGMEFKMIPFKGEERFAKLISSGMVDFYDNDSPAYILNVKLNDCPNELKEKLILVIRNSHTIKPSIFPTGKSIGAYWQSDRIEESIAQSLLRRTIINFTNKVNEI